MWWWIGGIGVWLLSAMCIIGTMVEMRLRKTGWATMDFWGAALFHGATAILALWMVSKALSG